jgi:hypothetical protein
MSQIVILNLQMTKIINNLKKETKNLKRDRIQNQNCLITNRKMMIKNKIFKKINHKLKIRKIRMMNKGVMADH